MNKAHLINANVMTEMETSVIQTLLIRKKTSKTHLTEK